MQTEIILDNCKEKNEKNEIENKSEENGSSISDKDIAASEENNIPTHQGYLHKRSKHLKIWKIRYFVLSKSHLYYSKRSGQTPKFMFDLKKLEMISSESSVEHRDNYTFELLYEKKKDLLLSCGTNDGRRQWTKLLQKLIQRMNSLNLPYSSLDSNVISHNKEIYAGPRRRSWFRSKRASKARNEERKLSKFRKSKTSIDRIWLEQIFPNWGQYTKNDVEWLCFAGIPKQIRGKAWVLLLGNKLQINKELFEICKSRAQGVKKELELCKILTKKKRETDQQQVTQEALVNVKKNTHVYALDEKNQISEISTPSGEQFDFSQLIVDGERNIRLITVDLPRTFGHHDFFKEGATGSIRVKEVLEAYSCYRPDVGYVQGMSYIAATLCFHMDSLSAFKAMVAIMSTRMMFDMYRLERERTFRYITAFEEVMKIELPQLSKYFETIGMDPKMYMVDWALTLFTRVLPLDVAYRLWDCYILFGTAFFYQASMGILLLHETRLLQMDTEEVMRMLHELPKSVTAEDIFSAVDAVQLSRIEIDHIINQGEEIPWSPIDNHFVEVDYPDVYD